MYLQSGIRGWSFLASLQQKNTLLHPLNFSSIHLIYERVSVDNLSASCKTIAALGDMSFGVYLVSK